MASVSNRSAVKVKVRAVQSKSNKHAIMVWRSPRHIYAYLCEPKTGRVIASVSTLSPSAKKQIKSKMTKKQQAEIVGGLIAKIAQSKGIESCCFNRSGFLYHGRVKALADAVREAGVTL